MIDWVQQFVHVVRLKRFFHRHTLTEYDAAQLDVLHRVRGTRASELFFDGGGEIVESVTYRPDQPGGVIVDGGCRVLNLYRRPTLTATKGDVTLWLELLAHIVRDDEARRHILDFFACLVQRPGIKINHALLLGGAQGIGKDSLLKPLIEAIGGSNVGIVTPLELDSPFNDWILNRSLIVVQELAAFTNRGLANRLKPLLAEPPHVLRLNRKFLPAFDVPNLVTVLAMTNSKRPLAIDSDDRRFYFYWSVAKPLDQGAYHRYHEWVEENAGVVLGYLQGRDIKGFDPKARPPMTASKRDLIADSLPLLRQHLIAILDSLPDLVTTSAILDRLPLALRSTSPRAIAHELRELGGRELRKIRLPNDTRPRLWALRRADFYTSMSESTLSRLFDAQRQPVPLLPRSDAVDLAAEVEV